MYFLCKLFGHHLLEQMAIHFWKPAGTVHNDKCLHLCWHLILQCLEKLIGGFGCEVLECPIVQVDNHCNSIAALFFSQAHVIENIGHVPDEQFSIHCCCEVAAGMKVEYFVRFVLGNETWQRKDHQVLELVQQLVVHSKV